MGKHVHRLSEVDPERRTAVCANCGSVQIVSGGLYKGEKQWRCKIIKKQQEKTEGRKAYMEKYAKDYYERTGGAVQHKAWIKQYGITPEDFQRMMEEQDSRCAICTEPCSSGQRLSVDHDHTTNKVRGLLCRNCNRGLGLFGDDADRMEKAAAYRRKYP